MFRATRFEIDIPLKVVSQETHADLERDQFAAEREQRLLLGRQDPTGRIQIYEHKGLLAEGGDFSLRERVRCLAGSTLRRSLSQLSDAAARASHSDAGPALPDPILAG